MEELNTNKISEISQTELSERVSILKRFKQLLEQQREKFQRYLKVLEVQELSIDDEDAEKIVQHAELGQALISEISSIKRVIDPIESMYRSVRTIGMDPKSKAIELETTRLKQDLQNLQNNILAQNKINRDKLKGQLSGLRKQIANIKNISKQKNIFSSDESASLIDLEA